MNGACYILTLLYLCSAYDTLSRLSPTCPLDCYRVAYNRGRHHNPTPEDPMPDVTITYLLRLIALTPAEAERIRTIVADTQARLARTNGRT